jgi:hypothetical protein
MINFISLTEYPTRKAYGVTLSGTYLAAIESGFEAQIIVPNIFAEGTLLRKGVLNCMQQLRKLYGGVPSLISKIAFVIHQQFFSIFLKIELDCNTSDIFWVRDLKLAQFLSKNFPNSKILIEIHQLQSNSRLRKLGSLPGTVILGPISRSVFDQLSNHRGVNSHKVIYLPMGVADYFFQTDQQVETVPEFDIGYFGSYKSSGYEQGIDQALIQLIPRMKSNPDFRILFAGIGSAGFDALSAIATRAGIENQIMLIRYLQHNLVPGQMMKCKTLLLPYPEGEYFESRFPIKALEYAAVRRPILCSRTKSHLNLFSGDDVWFYDVDNPNGILTEFDLVHNFQDIAARKIEKSFELALEHTYIKRFERIKQAIL